MERSLDALIQTISTGGTTNLHEIDIENLAGTGYLNVEIVREVKSRYLQSVPVKMGDVVLVAAGPQNKEAVFEGWGRAIYQFRKGKDGADDLLINFVNAIENLSMFSHLYLASGDGKLLEAADKASSHGVESTIVTFVGSKSWKLNKFRSINLQQVGA
jgi:hypothetical protein